MFLCVCLPFFLPFGLWTSFFLSLAQSVYAFFPLPHHMSISVCLEMDLICCNLILHCTLFMTQYISARYPKKVGKHWIIFKKVCPKQVFSLSPMFSNKSCQIWASIKAHIDVRFQITLVRFIKIQKILYFDKGTSLTRNRSLKFGPNVKKLFLSFNYGYS